MSDLKTELIEWIDSASTTGWNDFEAAKPLLAWSMGWLVKETDEYVVLSGSIGEGGQCSDPIAIPKVCIKTRETVFSQTQKKRKKK